MRIERLITGALEENCYILKDDNRKECLVIDPGADFAEIKATIGEFKVLNVLLTHDHFDHVGALEEVEKEYAVKTLQKNDFEEKEYQIGDFKFRVIFTPGHTADSITFYFEKEKIMFTGDFLFKGTIGRCDLPTGSIQSMRESILHIKKYPLDISVYPGHGEMTTLKEEIENNYYF